MYWVAVDTHKVFIKRSVVYRRWTMYSAIHFFIGLFATSVGVHFASWGDFWRTVCEGNNGRCHANGAVPLVTGWVSLC